MDAQPTYVMSAAPEQRAHFEYFFDSGNNSVMHLLANPGEFRYAGWDLQTLDRPRIMNGEYWEVTNGDRKTIQLYEDGTLIARVLANADFLGWGQHSEEFQKKPKLNPLAAIEVTTSFAYLYKQLLLRLVPQPGAIQYRLELHDAVINGNRLYLPPGELNSFGWMLDDQYKVSAPELEKEIQIPAATVINDPDHTAYLLVQRFYLFFNMPSDKIPYVVDGPARRINPASFSKRV